ncbi:MAG: NACHT domain-containing protein [Pseudonocardiaceae bacterium]
MSRELEFEAPVPRWVRVRNGSDGDDPPFDLDEDGFLPDPTTATSASAGVTLIRPGEALDVGALVLLGEPGAGKTTTFRSLSGADIDTLEPEPGEPGTLCVTGSELSDTTAFNEILGHHLAALPNVGHTPQSAGQLTVVLDQLDESTDLLRLPRRLERALAGKDTRFLRVLVACRTADYPDRLTGVLERALGRCMVADLAPLTRDDVFTLAAGTGVDAVAFVDTVTGAGVGSLASVPLTLKILLAAFRHDVHFLDRGPRELFELGMARLADEHDRDRAQDQFSVTSVEQRLVIASRIATRMVLSGQRTIWIGEHALAGLNDITEGKLSGDREDSTGAFEVTPAAVGETLKTALFSRSGRNRVAFAHSSFAAFLTARYFATSIRGPDDAARRRLSGVFLVAAPDEDTASIPVHLRETVAWLLAHAPEEYRWLASADPDGLIAHNPYITDSGTRAVMVDGLLRRAAEVELAEPSWRRTRWRLAHPGLADQLRPVLDHAVSSPSPEWHDFARARLAIHLARDGAVAEVTGSLLSLAEVDGWPSALRQNAAKAAMATNPAEAIPRLRALLATLATGSAARDDDHDELVGTLLSLLWPDHLRLTEILPHIRPIRDSAMYGMYRWQLSKLPYDIDESDLSILLDFVKDLVDEIAGLPDENDPPPLVQRVSVLSHELTVREFLTPIIDRVTLSPNISEYLPRLAEQMARLLLSSAGLTMPVATDLCDDNGHETDTSREFRRALAEALSVCFLGRNGTFDHYHVYVITSRWKAEHSDDGVPPGFQRGGRERLLDDGDFGWVLQRADHYRAKGEVNQADALGLLAASIADLYNPTTLELAYSRRDTPEGEHFRWVFDGVALDSDLATAMKANTPRPYVWEHTAAFADRQRQRLQAAADGDATAFWQLVHDLQFNPATGRYEKAIDTYDVRAYPGASLWSPDEFLAAFRPAARHYLRTEHDHRDEWLGTQTLDCRSNAGHAALVVLHDTGDLDDIQDRWTAWVGSVIDKAHRAEVPTETTLYRDLTSKIIRFAPAELTEAIHRLVRTTLHRGEPPWKLPMIVSLLPLHLQPVLIDLAEEVHTALNEQTIIDTTDTPPTTASDAPLEPSAPLVLPPTIAARDATITTWADLLRQPLIAGNTTATQRAERALAIDETNDTAMRLSVAAAHLLLTTDAANAWPRIHQTLSTSRRFAHDLAMACATTRHTDTVADALSDTDLIEAYRWLAEVAPPDAEVYRTGFVPRGQSIHDWRNALLGVLSRRGTPQAVRGIRTFVESFPDILGLQAALVAARRRAQTHATILLNTEQVIALLADPDRRIIRTAVQLAELLIDTITEIGRDLDSHPNLLWDCERAPVPRGSPKGTRRRIVWRPKLEGGLASYIAHELDLRLARRAIVINREVVIKPTDAGDSGERPDILVEAIAPDTATTVTVPIEIKGCWHEAVPTAQRTQLADRYLPAAQTDAGVYLIGWYPLDLWTADDRKPKRTAAKLRACEELLRTLQKQATEIHSQTGNRTFPYVLTIPRALPASTAKAPRRKKQQTI